MFRFEVEFWNEESPYEPVIEKGIAAGATYGEAVNRVVEYYGQENIIKVKVYELDTVLIDENLSDFE